MKVIILGTGDIALEVLKKLQEDARINVLGIICDESVRNEANEQYQKQVVSAGGKYTGVPGGKSCKCRYHICLRI